MARLLVAVAIGGLIGPRAFASRDGRGGTPLDPVGSGQIEQLVSAGDHLFAIRDGTVLTFDASGSLVGRCGRPVDGAARRPPRPFRLLDEADVLHDAGLSDDDGTLEAEDALDDEGAWSHRAAARPEPQPIRPRALAAAGGRAWAATSEGLYRVGPEGCRRAALVGRDLLAVAASESTMAVASANLLFQAEAAEAAAAGREVWRFRPLAALAARPRALAIDAAGSVVVADDQGVMLVDARGNTTRLLDRRARTLTSCGGTVAVLAGDGVYVWDGAKLMRTGDGPPARLLACGTGPRRWIAAGASVWSSTDTASWAAHAGVPTGDILALAVMGGRAWLAAQDGLTAVSLETGDALRAPAPRLGPLPPFHSVPVPVPASWVWPAVSALVTVDRTGARRAVTAFLLLRFPFDRPPPAPSDRSAVALQIARRDAALAAAQLSTGYGATTATDIVDREELAARREMAAEERETLR